jgi:hypothetical protein
MAQSSEYPDLKWIPPRAFGTGRDGKAVRYIVVHYTAGSERSTSAEDGAHNDQNRTDGTSTHYFVDSDSVVQCVLTKNRGNAARTKGNRLGIQYELCGTAQTRAQWLDAASDATLTNAARQMARDCLKYGIPVRRLSVSQTRADWFDFPAGLKGIVGHIDCTMAYPEDGGDHTDPGKDFPWDILLDRIQQFMTGADDMPLTEADLDAVEARAKAGFVSAIGDANFAVKNPAKATQPQNFLKDALHNIVGEPVDEDAIFAAITAVPAALLAKLGDPATPDAQVAAALVSLLGARKDAVIALMQQ